MYFEGCGDYELTPEMLKKFFNNEMIKKQLCKCNISYKNFKMGYVFALSIAMIMVICSLFLTLSGVNLYIYFGICIAIVITGVVFIQKCQYLKFKLEALNRFSAHLKDVD